MDKAKIKEIFLKHLPRNFTEYADVADHSSQIQSWLDCPKAVYIAIYHAAIRAGYQVGFDDGYTSGKVASEQDTPEEDQCETSSDSYLEGRILQLQEEVARIAKWLSDDGSMSIRHAEMHRAGEGGLAYIPGLGTVRACEMCGCLINSGKVCYACSG